MTEGNFYSEHLYQRSSKDTYLLEKNAEEYPHSALASFLLLYHYKKTSHLNFEKYSKKTALHFSNPHWLQFILYQKSKDNEIEAAPVHENKIEDKIEKPFVEIFKDVPAEITSTQNFVEERKEEKPNEEKKEESTYPEVIIENKYAENEIKAQPVFENSQHQNSQQVNEQLSNPEMVHQHILNEKKIFIKEDSTNNEEEEVAFDPLHTVDYFASQGIKLNEEELKSNDKLGSQMKSFTAWLKSMKKLHPAQLAEQSVISEKLIQSSAEESNINTDILTEAMAEVLIKQDKKEKAIDMFTKLSLINPAKSAYFAAKIESIKLR